MIDATDLARELKPLGLDQRLARGAAIAGRKVFTTSLGIEDQVLTAAVAHAGPAGDATPVEIVTLETGRLFPETVALIDRTEERYGLPIVRYRPAESEVASFVQTYSRDGFYGSVEARHACCGVRKVRPLARALENAAVWITGVRRGQSPNRAETPLAEYDAERGLLKINPLADFTIEDIRLYAAERDVPLNPLHLRGYPSIGCEPCTRAIKPGEPERAGRWWWEQDQTRECGLHVKEAAFSQPVSRINQPVSAIAS